MTEDSRTSFEGIDPDWANDFVRDLIHEKGTPIFELEWDSGGPGAGAGAEKILLFNKELFYSSMDFGLSGPHDSIASILAGTAWINSATVTVTFPARRKAEIMAALQVDGSAEGHEFLLNGDVWTIRDGQIRPEK